MQAEQLAGIVLYGIASADMRHVAGNEHALARGGQIFLSLQHGEKSSLLGSSRLAARGLNSGTSTSGFCL